MLLISCSIGFYVLLFRFLEFSLMVLCNLLQIVELTDQIFVVYLLSMILILYLNFLWCWLHPYTQFRFSWLLQMEVLKKNLIETHMIMQVLIIFAVRAIL